MLVYVVKQAPVRHQLRDQLDSGTQADTQQTHQVGVLDASHDQGLLDETDIHLGMWGRGHREKVVFFYVNRLQGWLVKRIFYFENTC